MQPSRRAFLFGRQRPRTSWEAFVQRLERGAKGRVQAQHADDAPRARFQPFDVDDVRLARTLCAEFGVALHLSGATRSTTAGSALEVDPSELTGLTQHPGDGRWCAQPGVRLADLVAAGLPQFQDASPHWTLAAWMAQPRMWLPGATADSGVVGVDALFSDGTVETLGPFGESDLRPLQSAMVQRLVPALFQAASSADGQVCRAAPVWPCFYRLDALRPAPPSGVNLAHLLLGHGGTLAWVESVTLAPGHPRPVFTDLVPSTDEAVTQAAHRLQIRVKHAFDSLDLFAG